jgi:hypothetical protein
MNEIDSSNESTYALRPIETNKNDFYRNTKKILNKNISTIKYYSKKEADALIWQQTSAYI